MSALRAAQADALRDVTRTCPGVADLGRGVATYLPGRKVEGVRRHDGHVEIHLVVDGTRPLPEVTEAVRRAASGLVEEPVDVVVEDVELGDDGGRGPGS